jgi:hypothetical protein
MRLRFGLSLFVSCTALLAASFTAWACLLSSGTVTPSSAGPNDPMGFSISGVEPGADYTVRVEGQQVAGGVNGSNNNGVSGGFSMPDLGDQPRTVYVYLDTHHDEDGYSWSHSVPVQYVPPVPTSSGSPESQSPAQQPVAEAKVQRSPTSKAVETGRDSSRRPGGGAGTAPSGSGPGGDVGADPGPRSPDSGSSALEASARESSGVPHRIVSALTASTPVGPADVPNLALGLAALIFVLGTALAAFIVWLLQAGPDPKAAIRKPAPLGADPVDIELQAIIATEMARSLLAELELPSESPDQAGLSG